MTIEIYRGIEISQDNTIRKFKVYSVIHKEQLKNPQNVIYSIVLYGSNIEILKRKIDKVLK